MHLGPGVTALVTTRAGGVSAEEYAGLDLALHVGDEPRRVLANRSLVERSLGLPVAYMSQVHGAAVYRVGGAPAAARTHVAQADALVTTVSEVALAVLVADCVPILLADPEQGVIGAVHAGRRGIVLGVLPAAVRAMVDAGATAAGIRAYLGPAICGSCYEVGTEVQDEVRAVVPEAESTTSWGTAALDLPAAAVHQLVAAGVADVVASGLCTLEDRRFYSHRRDGVTGRFAGIVALARGDTPRPPS